MVIKIDRRRFIAGATTTVALSSVGMAAETVSTDTVNTYVALLESSLLSAVGGFNDPVTRLKVTTDFQGRAARINVPEIEEHFFQCDKTNNDPALVNDNEIRADLVIRMRSGDILAVIRRVGPNGITGYSTLV